MPVKINQMDTRIANGIAASIIIFFYCGSIIFTFISNKEIEKTEQSIIKNIEIANSVELELSKNYRR